MTIKNMVEKLGFKLVVGTKEKLGREVTGVYCCDLISRALARLDSGNIWITVHTNLNVVAVASLTDVACVLIPEGIEVEDQSLDRAGEKQVVILSSDKHAAQLSFELISLMRETQ